MGLNHRAERPASEVAMQEYFDRFKVANTIRMLREEGHTGAILLIEADNDARWLHKFLDPQRSRLVPTFGKATALDALGDVEMDGGVLAVVDADFDHILGRQSSSDNAIRTDLHDVECMLLASPALEQVLAEYGSSGKLGGLSGANAPIRDVLLAAGRPVGAFLLAALPDHPTSDPLFSGLRFTELPFSDFLDKETLRIDRLALVRVVKNRSQRQDLDEDLALKRLDEQCRRHEDTDPWQLCRGHDLSAILLRGLCTVFGSQRPSQLTTERLESALRLAYSPESFMRTQLCAKLRRWQDRHPSYALFRDNLDDGTTERWQKGEPDVAPPS